jgi:membrane protein DedA with SNARE-associated domain
MHSLLEFLLHHGYLVLALWVFLEQAGLPLPSSPLLLAAGAVSGFPGKEHLNFFACLFLAVFASVLADNIWYQLGRHKGIKVLQWLCRISLEPDSCVRRTEGLFERQGAHSLLVAKFIPGLSAVATPLSGIFHMRLRRFLLFDTLGALLWVGTFLGLGYLFADQIEVIGARASQMGGSLLVLLLAVFVSYIFAKFVARQRFLRKLRISRITVDELKKKIDAGEELSIVDLRHSLDFEADPDTIPGAVHIDSKELTDKKDLLPPDREIILYCT